MPSTPLTRRESIDPADLRPVVYQTAVLAILLVLVGLATLLPGANRTVPGTRVSLQALVIALGTLAAVVVLARAARSMATATRTVLTGPDNLVDDAGRTAGALVVFAAVIVAHRGFAGVVLPTLTAGDATWAYDVGFLGLAAVPLGVIARRLWRNLDPVADHVAATLAHWSGTTDGRTEA